MVITPPEFSVVIPCFNAAQFLKGTLESVLNQTFQDWEVWVVDDGSSDDSVSIAQHFAQIDPRFHLVEAPHQGVSHARNVGAGRAQAPLLAFLDADDQWHPQKLEQHALHFDWNASVGVGFSRVLFISQDGVPTSIQSSGQIKNLLPQHFLYENPTTTTSSLVFRKVVFEQVGGFDESMSYAEDLELLLRVACCTQWKIEGLAEPLTLYRTNSAGLSSQLEKMHAGWEHLVEKIKPYAPSLVAEHYRAAKATHLRYLARRTLRLGASSAIGCRYVRQCLAADWRILIREPRRTLLTVVAVYLRHALQQFRHVLRISVSKP